MNTTIWRGVAALAICGAMSLPSAAEAQTVSDEVQCVTLGTALATGSNNERARQVGASISAYFLGRLDARQPAQIKAAIAAQKSRIGAAEAAAAMRTCAARAERAQAQLHALAK